MDCAGGVGVVDSPKLGEGTAAENLRPDVAWNGRMTGLPGSNGEVKVVCGVIPEFGLAIVAIFLERGLERGGGNNFTILKTNS